MKKNAVSSLEAQNCIISTYSVSTEPVYRPRKLLLAGTWGHAAANSGQTTPDFPNVEDHGETTFELLIGSRLRHVFHEVNSICSHIYLFDLSAIIHTTKILSKVFRISTNLSPTLLLRNNRQTNPILPPPLATKMQMIQPLQLLLRPITLPHMRKDPTPLRIPTRNLQHQFRTLL